MALSRAMAAGTVMDLMGLPENLRVPALETMATACAATDVLEPPAERAMLALLNATVTRGSVRRGSWMETIFQAVDAGKISEDEAIPLAAAYATAGIDSTVLGLAGAMVQLARHPAHWCQLRVEPARAEAAFHEAVRRDAPLQGLGRLVTELVTLDGVQLKAGERVWLLIGSAGRDPRKWGPTADTFDMRRPGVDKHLSLGAGSHACPGSHLTLMQARVLLRALADQCATLSPAGTPSRAQTHVLRGFTSAPIAITTGRSRTRARRATLTSFSESPQ